MSQAWSIIISIISIGAISSVLMNSLKYMALPHYRLEINRKKHNDDATAFLNFYSNVYKTEKNAVEKKSKFELQKLTNAAFGTKNFNYELIFLLFDKDVRDVEIIAKEIQKRWILIKVDYENKKIKSHLKRSWLFKIMILLGLLYIFVASQIIMMAAGYEWNLLKECNEVVIVSIRFILILIIAYFIYVLGSIKSIEKVIDWAE